MSVTFSKEPKGTSFVTRQMSKFMTNSRKLTGSQLNKRPAKSDDLTGNPKLNRSPKGLAHGLPVGERLNNKPLPIRKKASKENRPARNQTNLTASRSKPTHNKANKGIVRKYK